MKVMERCTQRIKAGKLDEWIAMEKKFDGAEKKLGGVPSKRRYWVRYGGLPSYTYVWEREWENLTDLDAYQAETMNNPEWNSLFDEANEIFYDHHFELYYSFTLDELPES
jgi:hypothetical protein